MNNFIKIDRKILKWEWWNDINTSRLFIYMLIAANWKDNNYKGEVIKRGSFPSSISELAKETSLTENEIRTALKHLKSTGEITSKSHSKYTIFTIKNYDTYQSINEQNYNQITSKITNSSQAINEHILKEDKNIKNINNNICSTELNEVGCEKTKRKTKVISEERTELEKNFEIIYNSYPKKVGKASGFKVYKQWLNGRDIGGTKVKLTNKQIWDAIARYKKYISSKETELQYVKQFDTFMRNILDYMEDEQ